MKKILLLLTIVTGQLFAIYDPCSSATLSGLPTALTDIEKSLQEQNQKVLKIWTNLNTNQTRKIQDNLEKKKKLLKNMQNLTREDDITETNQLHEVELKRELDGLLIDTWSVE
jgi:hypothetical protein